MINQYMNMKKSQDDTSLGVIEHAKANMDLYKMFRSNWESQGTAKKLIFEENYIR